MTTNTLVICICQGLALSIWFTCPIRHMDLKIDVSCKNFHMPSEYLYKPCKAYVYCWENKYMPWLKNHLPSQARNHKSSDALRKDLHAPGMRTCLNSLWPSDVIWRQGSRSTLAQVMVCCLTAPSHYLNQCWLMISGVLWHSPDSKFTENTQDIYRWNEFKIY